MAADWYYREGSQVVGPMPAKELRWLASQGSVKGDTRVRRGASGDWVAAETVGGLLEPRPKSEPEPVHEPEWRFMRDGRRLGPVSYSVLEELARSGRLKPNDLVASSDAPVWMPAEQVAGLFEPLSTVVEPPPTPPGVENAETDSERAVGSRPWIGWGVAAMLLVASAAVLIVSDRSSTQETIAPKEDFEEQISEDPFVAPEIEKEPELAARIVEPPPRPARVDVPDLIAEPVPEPPRQRIGGARPGLGVAADRVPLPLPIEDRPVIAEAEAEAVPNVIAVRPVARAASIDAILDAPETFLGRGVVLEGVFKIGTRILDPTEKNGSELGPTIPIAREDDRTLCTLEGRVYGRDRLIVVDARVARNLKRLFDMLRIAPSMKPSYRAILGARVEPDPREGKNKVPVIVVESLEILGNCDYYLVASRKYDRAFRVAIADASGGRTAYGNGDDWVTRLGGEEKFVGPVRRKLRDLMRRVRNHATGAVVDPTVRRQFEAWSRGAMTIQLMNALRTVGFKTDGP